MPQSFVESRRPDGSPNCSHAWARTVDGIQGGTWPQVHLLGTAALQRFTGYTGQSRSRYATHTWNVARLPEIDHGGVLADQRTPEREVLDALRRQPDTGFAIHDAPSRVERLLAERAELRGVPRPDRTRPRLGEEGAVLAHHRLDHAQQRLDEFGPLSQVRRHGRKEKASTLDQIDTFTNDVQRAESKIARCEQVLEELRPDLDQRLQWDADHNWPASRLRTVEAELAQSAEQSFFRGASLLRRAPGADRPAWLDRVADVARPPLPAHDSGAGIDLGF